MKKLLTCIFLYFITTIYANASSTKEILKDTKSWDGALLPSMFIYQPEITMKEIVLKSGEKLPVHQHPVISAGKLLTGELTIYNEDKTQSIHLRADSENSAIIEMVDKYHFPVNEGKEPAKILLFYIAEKGSEVTVVKPD